MGFRAIATASLASGTALTVAVPTGTADDDAMIAGIANESNDVPTKPAGWNELGSFARIVGGQIVGLYYRKASGEPASYDWTRALGSSEWRGYICSYSAVSAGGIHMDIGSPVTGATPLNVTLAAHSSFALDSALVHYSWGFGVGTGSYTAVTFNPDAAITSRGVVDATDNTAKLAASDETFTAFAADEPARTSGFSWGGTGTSGRVNGARIVMATCSESGDAWAWV